MSRAFRDDDGNDGLLAGDACSRRASISWDGSRIAFSSFARSFRNEPSASPFRPELDADTKEDVFFIDMYDIRHQALGGMYVPTRVNPSRASCTFSLESPDGDSFQPMLSATGDRIIFATSTTKLVGPGEPNIQTGTSGIVARIVGSNALDCTWTLGVCCEIEGETMVLSTASDGSTVGNDDSLDPTTMGDGRVVAYVSQATNLIAIDANGKQDLFETLSPQGDFKRGDANGDTAFNISDVLKIQNWLFNGAPPPPCLEAADVNDDGSVNQTDSVFLLNWLFAGGSAPPPPACGSDASSPGDTLTCAEAPGCAGL